MRMWYVFVKTVKEQIRNYWDLILVLSIAPFFVVLYWSFVGGGSTNFDLLVLDYDVGICAPFSENESCAELAVNEMQRVSYNDGTEMLRIEQVVDRALADKMLLDRNADALVVFPVNFSAAVKEARETQQKVDAPLVLVGDLSNTYYSIAAILVSTALDDFLGEVTNRQNLIVLTEEPLGESQARTEFELYVPGLLVTALAMMIFSIAMSVTREIESGTLQRLALTRMNSFDLLGGISLMYMLIGLLAVLITYAVATLLGFTSVGPLWLAILISALTCLSIIGTGLITACFSKTVVSASIISMFPIFLMAFFTGAVFPIPKLPLFSIGGRVIALFDLLPPSHAVAALNKVLSLGAGPLDILYELSALTVLSILYFIVGVVLFQRRQLIVS
ncbi:MAG: ABC transporter permease [Anaerolineaceae bacterium]|nr:ABC transporter permease [Anaerolineaceae bacterium]